MRNKLELLAPVGRWEVLEAVVAAGADAVYLGSKKYNMRLHRSDYHFTDDQLVSAVNFAHKNGVKVYVTVNNLLSTYEIDEIYLFLGFLQDIGVDAAIVHDLGVIRKVHEMDLKIELHSSTMMNTHSVLMAEELKSLGVSRIITSRDIDLNQAKTIHEQCDIEVEYFVHGDMCSAQSGQCYSSGVLFAKSSNRGECMKPCRWNYSLTDAKTGQIIGDVNDGHFLAMNDLCLLQYIPSLVDAGICSFKIEGRMRDAKYLGETIAIYRKAIDSYINAPGYYYTDVDDLEHIFKTRVRNLSTSVSFALASSNTFDYSGEREPLFLSKFCSEKSLTNEDLQKNPFVLNGSFVNGSAKADHDCLDDCEDSGVSECCKTQYSAGNLVDDKKDKEFAAVQCIDSDKMQFDGFIRDMPDDNGGNGNGKHLSDKGLNGAGYSFENRGLNASGDAGSGLSDFNFGKNSLGFGEKSLSVKISTFAALKSAVSAGADYVYLSGEVSPSNGEKWSVDRIKEAANFTHENGKRFGLGTPRISRDLEMGETRRLLDGVNDVEIDSVIVHNLGTLRLAREFGFEIFADFSFNVINRYSAALLKQIGVSMACASVELSFGDLVKIANESELKIECVVHGQIPFMVLEHCLPALVVTKSNARGVCRQLCRHGDYALRDEKGEVRPIEVDQYCRNHIYFASDLCVLPYLGSFMRSNVSSLRIEAQHYSENIIGTIVKLYRKQMDIFERDLEYDNVLSGDDWIELNNVSPRKLGLGAYNNNILKSKKTAEVIKSLN